MRKVGIAIAGTLLLAGCASSTAQLDSQVQAEATVVGSAATAATAAYNAGLVKNGSALEADLDKALKAAQAALDNADASMKAGDTSQVSVYLSSAAAAITEVSADIAKAKNGGTQ